jgi:hypothetical protein
LLAELGEFFSILTLEFLCISKIILVNRQIRTTAFVRGKSRHLKEITCLLALPRSFRPAQKATHLLVAVARYIGGA